MRNEWKAIKTLLQQSCCKKKWLWSAAFICLGIVWKILSLSGRPEVAEDFSPLFFAVAGIMPMEILLVNDISGFVKGSVLRKKIQTTMATKSMFAGTMIAYLMYLAFLAACVKGSRRCICGQHWCMAWAFAFSELLMCFCTNSFGRLWQEFM